MERRPIIIAVLVLIGSAAVIWLLLVTDTMLYLRSQVALEIPGPATDTKTFELATGYDTPVGARTLRVVATDSDGNTTMKDIVIRVEAAPGGTPLPVTSVTPVPSVALPPEAVGGESGGSHGGGGGASDGERSSASISLPRSFTFQAENGVVAGSYSGIEPGGKTVVLAHPKASLTQQVNVPRGTYSFLVRARDDRPGPVQMVVYINNRAWKVIELPRNDNQYRTRLVGTLRNFTGGTVQFRLLRDQFNPQDPTNADADRNLHLDWWRLTPVS